MDHGAANQATRPTAALFAQLAHRERLDAISEPAHQPADPRRCRVGDEPVAAECQAIGGVGPDFLAAEREQALTSEALRQPLEAITGDDVGTDQEPIGFR